MSSFHRQRVASRSRDAASACRPFDESRDGFLIGEGAGVMILESRAHASARSAQRLAKVISGGWLSDPTGMTQIDTSGAVVAELLRRSGLSLSLTHTHTLFLFLSPPLSFFLSLRMPRTFLREVK